MSMALMKLFRRARSVRAVDQLASESDVFPPSTATPEGERNPGVALVTVGKSLERLRPVNSDTRQNILKKNKHKDTENDNDYKGRLSDYNNIVTNKKVKEGYDSYAGWWLLTA